MRMSTIGGPESVHLANAAAVVRQTDACAALVEARDLTGEVATCPGWKVLDLVKHLGVVQRWAAQMMRDRASEELSFRHVDRQLPADPAGYAEWLRASGQLAGDALRAAPADAPVWTWGDGHVHGWWSRRLVHETVVHRADVAFALGEPFDVDPAIAVDGIDELLENLPAAGARGLAPRLGDLVGHGEQLAFATTDTGDSWAITIDARGAFRWERASVAANASLRAPSATLLLVLYRRLPTDAAGVEVRGDDELLTRWLQHATF